MDALIVLGTIMAAFGVLGYQRGTRSSLFIGAVVVFGLSLLTRLASSVATAINGLYFGVRFILAGGLGALGSGGNRAAAIDRVVGSMGTVSGLVSEESAGLAVVLTFVLILLAGVLLTRAKWFKPKPSFPGLLIGLGTGYLAAAFILHQVWPESNLALPLPELLGGNAAASQGIAGSESELAAGFSKLISESLDERTLALVIVLSIALFVLVATRSVNKRS